MSANKKKASQSISSRGLRYSFPIEFTRLVSKISTIEHKKCAFNECNRYVPIGKKGIYCNPKCRSKAMYRRRLAESGKKLTWRGIKRPGL